MATIGADRRHPPPNLGTAQNYREGWVLKYIGGSKAKMIGRRGGGLEVKCL